MKTYRAAVMALLLSSAHSAAATHTINFGGALGNTYSPSNLTAVTGDTIVWKGSFSSHPLSSVSFPSGAAAVSKNSGTELRYVVEKAGTYKYICDLHPGMTGQIAVQGTPVIQESGRLQQNGVVRITRSIEGVRMEFTPDVQRGSWALIDIQGHQIAHGSFPDRSVSLVVPLSVRHGRLFYSIVMRGKVHRGMVTAI